jgi:hypothetical protein
MSNFVNLYVDNSNIFIEAQRAAENKGEIGKACRIYFKNFIDLALSKRMVKEVVWGGSIPPENDSVWSHLKSKGVDPDLIPRSESGENETVDHIIQLKMHRHSKKYKKQPGTIVVGTGDGKGYNEENGFLYDLEGFLDDGWKIEVMSWEHSCHSRLREFAEKHGKFISLDKYYDQITFISGGRVVKPLSI